MNTTRRIILAVASAGILGLLAAGCGGGGNSASGGTSGGQILNTLPAPEGAARVRMVNNINDAPDSRAYRLRADGTYVTEAVTSGEIATGGEIPTGQREFGVVDTRFDVPVTQFDRSVGPGLTTVILYQPRGMTPATFSVTSFDVNQAPANREYAGVRVANYASSTVAADLNAEEFTFIFNATGISRSLPGQKYGVLTATSFRPGNYQAKVLRADGTAVMDTSVTIPEANHRYTLLLVDAPQGSGGSRFVLLTDQ